MKRLLTRLVVYVAASLVVLNVLFYFQQPAMVFFPLHDLDSSPRDWGLAFEDEGITTPDGEQLHGWYVPCATPGPNACATLLFLHGNGGNIAHRGESLRIFHQLGMNVLIFDYRGYGRSSGSPSEQGLYTDARSAWNYLREQRGLPAERIIVFGRSLGGVLATRLAAEVRPAGLIVESSFTSARDMSRHVFPWLSHVILLRYEFDAARAMRAVQVPVLVLHSPEDEIIPFELGQALFAQAREPRTFVQLRGDHNYGFLLSQPAYQQALRAFLDRLPP